MSFLFGSGNRGDPQPQGYDAENSQQQQSYSPGEFQNPQHYQQYSDRQSHQHQQQQNIDPSQQQHPLGTLNSNYRQLIEEEERQKKLAQEEEDEANRQRDGSQQTRSNTNDSPPTSPPRSEAPPPSDDEFTNFVLRRAAKQLGVDFIPGQFSQQNSPHNHHHQYHDGSNFQPPKSMMPPTGKSKKSQRKKKQVQGEGDEDNNNNERERGKDDEDKDENREEGDGEEEEEDEDEYHHRSASQQRTSGNRKNHQHQPSSRLTAGAAHPIDALKSHHWQEQVPLDDLGEIPVPRFPATLKAARRIASVEKRLQEPPPSGLQRFGQFIDCSVEEIARMIDLRETSLGQTHASVPPLYDVLGDMLLFEGDTAQAEKYYTTCLARLEQRSIDMQKKEKEDLEKLQRGGGSRRNSSAADANNNKDSNNKKSVSRFHPSNKSNPSSWLAQAANWSQEVATLNGKLGMLWLQQGKKEAAASAFIKAAELADPSSTRDHFSYHQPSIGRAGSVTSGNYKRGQSPNPTTTTAGGKADQQQPHQESAFTRFGGKNEAPEITHLRQLLGGVIGPMPTNNNTNTSSSADQQQQQPKDRKAIAAALADRVLIGLKSPTKTTESQTVLSSTARGNRNRNSANSEEGGGSNTVEYNHDDFAPISGYNSRSGSQQQNQQNANNYNGLPPARLASTTPVRRGGSQSTSSMLGAASGSSPLHDASSLRNLVDSITHDGKVEDSRRRMRSSLGQLQQTSLSPQRIHHHHGSGSVGGSSSSAATAETNDTLRKTKDLQDIISRIRRRTDLMTANDK